MRTFLSLLCLFVLTCHVTAQEAQKKQAGLKPIYVNGKWGYANESGKVIITPQFVEARNFSEGLAAVAFGTDPNAKSFISGGSKYMTYSIGVQRTDLIWGYIDETGKFIIKPRFNNADDFSEGLAGVMLGSNWWRGKWGYIDKYGQMAIKPRFEIVTKFINGRAWAVIRERESSKNAKLEKVPGTKTEGGLLKGAVLLDRPDELLCRGNHGYIDRKGKFTKTTCDEWFARKVEVK